MALPQGLDVASWQGQPDWAAVAAAGYTFAITKETQGIGYVNPTAARNWPEIKAAGMFRGAYHYANPDTNGPEAEADFFVTHMLGVGLEAGDVLALDLEEGSGDLGGWALRWLKRVEERVGFAPILYTGPWIINEHDLAATPELGRFGLWLAAYQPTMPAPPAPWETIAIWQNASDVSVPGIVGPVDHDYFNGDIARLPLYGKPGAVPAPVPVGGWDVGAGILEAMAARGDSAATSEAYVTADWSEAIGTSGTVYRWVKSVGRVFVYPPAA